MDHKRARNKRYRQNVAAVILSPKYPDECKFFIGLCKDVKNRWQFPQGGIDNPETPKEALLRELEEEIGCNNVEILGEFPEWITYDFPNIKTKKRYPYDGQTQKYFLVKLRNILEIDLNAYDTPEFKRFEFVTYDEVFKKVTYFKRDAYKKVIDYFIKEGYI